MSNTSSPPPLVGFNNNVRYRGMRFHIQTEDSGVARPHIITHLFADGGHIIKSLRTNYAEYVDHPERPQLIAKMMREQHRAMALELRGGALDGTIERLRAAAAETERVPESAALAPPPAREPAPAEPVEAAPTTARSAELATRRASGDDIASAVVTAAVESSRAPSSTRGPASSRRNAVVVSGEAASRSGNEVAADREAASSRRAKGEASAVSSRRKGSTLRPAVSQRNAAPGAEGAGDVTSAAPASSRNAAPSAEAAAASSRNAAPTSSRNAVSSTEVAPTSSRDAISSTEAVPTSNAAPAPEAAPASGRTGAAPPPASGRGKAKPGPRRTASAPRKAGRPALLPEKPTGESLFGALPKESLDDAILSYVSHAKPPPSSRGSK